jgi:hypothetical protein
MEVSDRLLLAAVSDLVDGQIDVLLKTDATIDTDAVAEAALRTFESTCEIRPWLSSAQRAQVKSLCVARALKRINR